MIIIIIIMHVTHHWEVHAKFLKEEHPHVKLRYAHRQQRRYAPRHAHRQQRRTRTSSPESRCAACVAQYKNAGAITNAGQNHAWAHVGHVREPHLLEQGLDVVVVGGRLDPDPELVQHVLQRGIRLSQTLDAPQTPFSVPGWECHGKKSGKKMVKKTRLIKTRKFSRHQTLFFGPEL